MENASLSELEAAEEAAIVESSEHAAAPARAALTLKRSGAETADVFEFSSPATVGRFDPAVGPIDVDLGSIDEGVYVSRKHARFVCEEGVWRVEDLGSSNGTFILRNDFEKVDSAELNDGDEIAFGNARFVFRLAKGDSAMPAEADPDPGIETGD